jgi:hypothetical protein
MKSLAVAVAALLVACNFLGCGEPQPPGSQHDAPPGGADDDGTTSDDCNLPADPFAVTELEAGVTYLASDNLAGRASNTPGDEATRKYIEDAFRCLGLTPGGPNGSFQQPFTAPDGTKAANVIGYLPGNDPTLASEVIIIGAHHDHLGTMGGEIYNGANDNASGTIALIAMARALKASPAKRTVGFVAFGYEEHDGNCEGSEYFVDHPPPALAMTNVKYMVDYDMVGTYALANELTVYGASAGSKARIALDGLAPTYAGIQMRHADNADSDSSDFQAFADLGKPYVYFETWDDACYHKPCDDAARIDYASMAKIARLGVELVKSL